VIRRLAAANALPAHFSAGIPPSPRLAGSGDDGDQGPGTPLPASG
jgi:hypothetical protein